MDLIEQIMIVFILRIKNVAVYMKHLSIILEHIISMSKDNMRYRNIVSENNLAGKG